MTSEQDNRVPRRYVLGKAAAGAAGVMGLAGCMDGDSDAKFKKEMENRKDDVTGQANRYRDDMAYDNIDVKPVSIPDENRIDTAYALTSSFHLEGTDADDWADENLRYAAHKKSKGEDIWDDVKDNVFDVFMATSDVYHKLYAPRDENQEAITEVNIEFRGHDGSYGEATFSQPQSTYDELREIAKDEGREEAIEHMDELRGSWTDTGATELDLHYGEDDIWWSHLTPFEGDLRRDLPIVQLL